MYNSNAGETKKILLIKVDDTFQVTGHGLILSPWLLLSQWEHKFKSTRTEVKLLIKKPEGVDMITSGLILYPFLTPTKKTYDLLTISF
jgi:hypothetical protein